MKDNVFSRVVECISATTRYPVKLLVADADLENDLGVDSVKRLEIVVALEEEFGVALSNRERDPSIRTISDIASWVENMISSAAPDDRADQREVPDVVSSDVSRSVVSSDMRRSDFDQSDVNRIDDNGHGLSGLRTPRPDSFESRDGYARRDHVMRHHEPHSVAAPHFTPNRYAPEPVANYKPLAGKVTLVTGSGRGIGRVIARVLASKGATVIVNSFHSREAGEQTAEEIRAQGGSAMHVWGSVANPKHVDEIFSQIESHFGRLDILVCNASDGRIGSFMELQPEDWNRAFQTNVVGHHQCAIRASSLMRRVGGGSIITMSAVGSKGWVDGLGSQGVVKAAVETLTRYLACELAPLGIRANCVAGGPVYGELLDQFPDTRNVQHRWEANTPDRQLCSPLDLANAIAFLASEDARGINGSVWVVDHGFSAVADTRTPTANSHARTMPARTLPATF